jgi:hypothetical protein
MPQPDIDLRAYDKARGLLDVARLIQEEVNAIAERDAYNARRLEFEAHLERERQAAIDQERAARAEALKRGELAQYIAEQQALAQAQLDAYNAGRFYSPSSMHGSGGTAGIYTNIDRPRPRPITPNPGKVQRG